MTPGAGRECRGICALANTCRSRRPKCWWSLSHRRKGFSPIPRRPVGRDNYLRFRSLPSSAIALAARVKRAGKEFVGDQHELYLSEEQPGEETPYERLLGDAMAGDGALFTREDAVEAAWAVVNPVLKTHHRVRPYKRHTWGPREADTIISARGCWHNPKPNEASE